MNTLPRSPFRRNYASLWVAAMIAMLGCTHPLAGAAPSLRGPVTPPTRAGHSFRMPVSPFDEFRWERFPPDAFLTGKGLVSTELKWAVNMPDLTFTLLLGPKGRMAQRLHAEKVRVRKVQRIHDMIDLVGLTDPPQAKAYRHELHRALAASR